MAYDGHDLHELVMLQVCDCIGLHDSLDVVSWIPLASLPSFWCCALGHTDTSVLNGDGGVGLSEMILMTEFG